MTGRSRLAYVDHSLWWGGAEESLCWLASGLAARGHEVEIIVDAPLAHQERYLAVGLELRPRLAALPWWAAERRQQPVVGLDRLGLYLRARWLERYCAERRPDIVHFNRLRERSHWDVVAARRSGAKVVGHLRPSPFQTIPQDLGLDACDRVVAVSHDLLRPVLAANCLVPGQVIADGVDPERFVFRGTQVEARRRFGLPVDAPTIALPASLEPGKGQDTALDAFRALAPAHPKAQLVFAGSRTIGAGAKQYVNGLVQQSLDPAIAGRVHFLGRCDDMAAFYAAADLVLALRHEGQAIGRIVAEAACAGKPLIATPWTATSNDLIDGVTGLCVEPGNAEEACAAIDQLLQNDRLRRSMANEARRRAARQVDPERTLRAFEALYMSLQTTIAA